MAPTRPADAQAAPGYVYQDKFTFVRIEPIEPAAPDNTHPATISPTALRRTLETMQAKGSLAISARPIFTSGQLDEIVTPLVAALAKAGPRDDVTFASSGFHGWAGKYSPPTITTGRVFVSDGTVNVVFGMVHELYEYTGYAPEVTRSFVPGSRARRVETGWEIVAVDGAARVRDGRSDWALFEVPTKPLAAPAPDASQQREASAPAPAAPADDGRYQEIERKLQVLERLKANGLVTDEEYRERRRAILQGI